MNCITCGFDDSTWPNLVDFQLSKINRPAYILPTVSFPVFRPIHQVKNIYIFFNNTCPSSTTEKTK